ncbi:MAG: EamA family transporter [Pseudomonadota bacterium]|nr:EamA family transporter [Pseudomonadota bacterium]
MTLPSLLRLLALAGIWGMSFIFLRVTAPHFSPALTAWTRVALGAALLCTAARAAGVPLQWRQRLGFHFVVGFFNSALPFFLFAWAAARAPSAYLAIMNAMAPLFAAAFGRLLSGERLSAQRLAGFAVGVLGVAVLVGLGPATPTPRLLAGVAGGLAAAACYGFAAVHMRRHGDGLAPLGTAAGSLLAATLMLLPPVLAGAWRTQAPLPVLDASLWQALVAVGLLGLVCTGLAYALYFRLVADEGSGRAVTVTFLVPLAATLWGVALLHEHITPVTLAGMALVLSGTALSLGLLPALPRPVRARA